MKKGDFIRIDYIARIKESGKIFDLTNEKVAKEEEVYNPQIRYGPMPVIIGSEFLIKGLENALKDMKVGEKKHLVVEPKDAFGERSEKLIKLIPESEFSKQDMVPYQGMPVRIKNLQGRVLSVSGGRVKVDFNHPLAGKELEYDIEIKEEIKDDKEKVRSILQFFYRPTGKEEVNLTKNKAEIKVDTTNDLPGKLKSKIAETVVKWIDKVEKVSFIEEYSPSMSDTTQINKNTKNKK
jgi:FKBP-type peptidyl-prolyl cis-trans isomerase 2